LTHSARAFESSGTAGVLALALGICAAAETPQPVATLLTLPQHDKWRSPSDMPPAGLSADGKWIAFESYARLAPADTNDNCDVYVLDRTTGRVTLESVTTEGDLLPGESTAPRLSGDGHYLVFQTMITGDDGLTIGSEIVLRDRQQHTTKRVSRSPSSVIDAGSSRHAAISDDGRFVVFASSVTDLVAGLDRNERSEDVYLYDRVARHTQRISVDRQGVQLPDGASFSPSISADGRYVAFTSTATLDGVPARLVARRRIASVFVRDIRLGLTERVNVTVTGAPPDGHSSDPAISRDGRYVAFGSEATNLVRGDRNRSADVFLRDLREHTTSLVSRGMSGGAANGPSGLPTISGDGRFVAFQSLASDLLCRRRCDEAGDINLLWDVYRFDRMTGSMGAISRAPAGAWSEESIAPQLDASGEIVAFSSRHPIDERDEGDDFDLFVRVETPAAQRH
jgi:Tol biopolymer transport system component